MLVLIIIPASILGASNLGSGVFASIQRSKRPLAGEPDRWMQWFCVRLKLRLLFLEKKIC